MSKNRFEQIVTLFIGVMSGAVVATCLATKPQCPFVSGLKAQSAGIPCTANPYEPEPVQSDQLLTPRSAWSLGWQRSLNGLK